ncbi:MULTISPECIES: CU044_5270 family protein [unclassified Nonomuraea]|uniref:CU044_5270 family protein n=1 Tax=unclassified Nonomuraea TaxID=2593643 RepID=UPI0034013F76
MDDLREIRTLLAKPDPAPEVVARRRRQVQAGMRRRAPLRRARWLLVPVAAAAAAAAFVIVPGRSGEPAPSFRNGREVLLVAAVSAERTPEGSGTYWHITVTHEKYPVQEYWYRRDGSFWLKGKGLKGEGKLFKFPGEPQPFAVGPLRMTFEELRRLPDDENALYDRLRSAVTESDLRTSAGSATTAEQDGFAVDALVSLVSEAPVSPQVRAAAYRALASRPGVVDLGETDGGRRLRLPVAHTGAETVVVDPETARVRNTPLWFPLTGGAAFVLDGGVTIDAEWTDHLPAE